ncbi:MAG: T9SS type A sorting domain-containing protein [Flavobacteriales bacterium]|nr:T9SS type A sorting domain-containing protein [Flavobacteriales bacterium]
MKSIILIIIVVLSSSILVAQDDVTTYYAYDDAGNRVLRYMIELDTEDKTEQKKLNASKVENDDTTSEELIDIVAYPNPFIDEVNFVVNADGEPAPVSVVLLDATGKELYKGEHQSGEEVSIKVDRQVGVCLLKVVQGNKVASVKIVGE